MRSRADVQVTVVAQIFNSTGSKFTYGLSVRKPDPAGVAGLSATQTSVVAGNTATAVGAGKVVVHVGASGFVGHVYYIYKDASGNDVRTDGEGDLLAFQTATYNPGLKGVPVVRNLPRRDVRGRRKLGRVEPAVHFHRK